VKHEVERREGIKGGVGGVPGSLIMACRAEVERRQGGLDGGEVEAGEEGRRQQV